jgi:hypothetical protein
VTFDRPADFIQNDRIIDYFQAFDGSVPSFSEKQPHAQYIFWRHLPCKWYDYTSIGLATPAETRQRSGDRCPKESHPKKGAGEVGLTRRQARPSVPSTWCCSAWRAFKIRSGTGSVGASRVRSSSPILFEWRRLRIRNSTCWRKATGASTRSAPCAGASSNGYGRGSRRSLPWTSIEELLMKLGAARARAWAAWRLVNVEVAPEAAAFSFTLW